ncbi:MAG: PAS domain S-box protein [Chloroflexi bacterium]|nr:MAG: PAS domain S-box protein [Chloroflexota bacterium]
MAVDTTKPKNTGKFETLFDSFYESATAQWLKEKITLILDVGLILTAILMLATDAVIFYFHFIFLLLTVGAFYWQIRAFTIRAVIWVSAVSAMLLISVVVGEVPIDEMTEIPMMAAILVLVFIIGRRRAIAENALRVANEELESRVASRTHQLTTVNADLTVEVARRRETESILRESEERYRRLVELSFEAVAIHSNGKIVDLNSAGVKMLGAASTDDIIGKPILDFVHPDYVNLVQTRVGEQVDSDQGVPLIEEKFLRLDGSEVSVEVAAVPITLEGQPAIQTVIRDITARKQAETEREILLATEREQRLLAETLGDVFLALAAQTSHETVLDEILRQARRLVSFSAANIVLLKGEKLIIARHQGYMTFDSRRTMANLEQSLVDLPLDREAVETRQPVVIPDTRDNTNWVITPELNWIRSFIALPICLGDRVLGLLRLDSNVPGKFSEKDVNRLQSLVNAAAIALENTRLYDQARQEIAERIQVERALRRSAANNQAILNAITDSIFHLRRDGRLLDYKIQEENQSEWARKVTGGSKTLQEIFPPDLVGLILNFMDVALSSKVRQIFEYRLKVDKNTRNLEFRLVPTGDNEVLALLADITDYKAGQAALEKERARIARDLHDSLGQSMGYLRLKLDQYSMEGAAVDSETLRQELVHMRDVANESYEIVRSMLAAARPSNSNALHAVLLAQARSVGSRARFKVELNSEGQARALPPVVQQQVLFICQEALNNIEKHAAAEMVNIDLIWQPRALTIKMVDDGHGFRTDVAVEQGHFGLTIMQERATEINGRLTINSAPGRGTELVLEIPVAPVVVPPVDA